MANKKKKRKVGCLNSLEENEMVLILVGSENPVKLESVRVAFSQYFNPVDVVGRKVPSFVPDQPLNGDTYLGARNRVQELQKLNLREQLNADFFVGIEGGVVEMYGTWMCNGVMYIMDRLGKSSYGTSAHFQLPPSVLDKVKEGIELGDLTDALTGQHNTKQKGGVIAYLTKGAMDRKALYVPGLIVALVPFVNREIYFPEQPKP